MSSAAPRASVCAVHRCLENARAAPLTGPSGDAGRATQVGIALTHQLICVTDLINVEAVTGFAVDLEKEFRMIGVTCLLSALSLTMPNYMSIGQTITAWRTGGWVERRDKRSSAWKRRSSKQENHNRVARASLPAFRGVVRPRVTSVCDS